MSSSRALCFSKGCQPFPLYDNLSSYFREIQVRGWLLGKSVELHFLPAYSPNLNPIERLWKFMRAKVIDSFYWPSFAEFRDRIMGFLAHLEPYRAKLERLLVLKFAIVQNQTLVAI